MNSRFTSQAAIIPNNLQRAQSQGSFQRSAKNVTTVSKNELQRIKDSIKIGDSFSFETKMREVLQI